MRVAKLDAAGQVQTALELFLGGGHRLPRFVCGVRGINALHLTVDIAVVCDGKMGDPYLQRAAAKRLGMLPVVESEGLDPTGIEEVQRCMDFLKTVKL